MIATRIVRLSVILILSLWQTEFAGGSFGESAMNQSVMSSNQWWYVDGVLAKSNLRHPPLVVHIKWRSGAVCGLLRELFEKKR